MDFDVKRYGLVIPELCENEIMIEGLKLSKQRTFHTNNDVEKCNEYPGSNNVSNLYDNREITKTQQLMQKMGADFADKKCVAMAPEVVIQRQIDLAMFDQTAGKGKARHFWNKKQAGLGDLRERVNAYNDDESLYTLNNVRQGLQNWVWKNEKILERFSEFVNYLSGSVKSENDRLLNMSSSSGPENASTDLGSGRKMEIKFTQEERDAMNNSVEAIEYDLEAFTSALKKIGKKPNTVNTSLTDHPPGMQSDGTIDTNTIVEERVRWYGHGFVSGKYKIIVNNLKSYDFTGHHTFTAYDDAAGGGYFSEDQSVTLPGSKLKYIKKEGKKIYYDYID